MSIFRFVSPLIKVITNLYSVIASNSSVILADMKRAREERALARIYSKMARLFCMANPTLPQAAMEALMPAMIRQLRKAWGKTSENPIHVAVWTKNYYYILRDGDKEKIASLVKSLLAQVQETPAGTEV